MKKRAYVLILSALMLSLSACGNVSTNTGEKVDSSSEKNNEQQSEEKIEDDMVIVSHEIDDCAEGDYYKVIFTIKNETDKKVTYQYIGLREIGENNVVKNDFNSSNQMSMETELEPNQAALQENMFSYADNLQAIEVDTYCYLDDVGNYIEKNLSEKYVVDVSELSKNIAEEEADTQTEDNEKFVAQGNITLMNFLNAASDNGYSITNPNNDGTFVTATAKGENGDYKVQYMVEQQKVYAVGVFAESEAMLQDDSYLDCVCNMAKSINNSIDEETIKDAVNQAITSPDTQIVQDSTMFRYDSEDLELSISY